MNERTNERTPLVSVIVPVYNAEKYLEECIDSILKQTLQNIEIILVDDGSTDTSPAICDAYLDKDNRIKVLHKENGGLSSARNAGLDAAIGDYFAFVDSDDIVDENMYKEMLQIAHMQHVPLVICSGYYFSDTHKDDMAPVSDDIEMLTSHEMISDKLWSDDSNTLLFTLAWNKLFRRDFFEDIRFQDKILLHEDEEFSTRLYLPLYKLCIIRHSLYGYRKNENSLTYRAFSTRNCVILDILRLRAEKYSEIDLKVPSAKAGRNFVEIYITYYYRAAEMHHVEWVTEYKRFLFLMLRKAWKITTVKDKIRYSIFAISPQLYNNLVLRKRLGG